MKIVNCFVLFLFLGLLACNNSSEPQPGEKNMSLPYFDLEAFFQNEINRLNELQPLVDKRVRINTKEESNQLDDINYTRELKVFSDSDINRVAWFDKYSIDNTLENNQLNLLRYEAIDESLRTRNVEIELAGEEVREISIENQSESFIASAFQKLIYRPASGYSILTSQKMKIGKDKVIEIEVNFR